jgi:Pentapeptide repeats (8 copies)
MLLGGGYVWYMERQEPSQPPTEPTVQELQKKKLELEIEQLRIANGKNEPGLTNFLYSNAAVIVAAIAGTWAIFRYIDQKTIESTDRQEERFESLVKNLGSTEEEERIGAAVLLPTFLQERYERFYPQVFNLAAGNLRKKSTTESEERPGPVVQALASVFIESYPLARDYLVKKRKKSEDIDMELLIGSHLNATGVQLDRVYLRGADLTHAWLGQASLQQATLEGVTLKNAFLEKSNMSNSILTAADLSGGHTNLRGATLTEANLEFANLSSASASEADFSKAILKNTNLTGANLIGAKFDFADLTDANLTDADLGNTDLRYAKGWTNEQLAKAESLVGAKLGDDTVIKTEKDWEEFKKSCQSVQGLPQK